MPLALQVSKFGLVCKTESDATSPGQRPLHTPARVAAVQREITARAQEAFAVYSRTSVGSQPAAPMPLLPPPRRPIPPITSI